MSGLPQPCGWDPLNVLQPDAGGPPDVPDPAPVVVLPSVEPTRSPVGPGEHLDRDHVADRRTRLPAVGSTQSAHVVCVEPTAGPSGVDDRGDRVKTVD